MRFEWDRRKAEANLRKHGVAFDDAWLVFEDPLHFRVQDRYEGTEERWQAIGQIGGFLLLVVAHTTWGDEQGTEVIRIISARRATPRERRRYEEQ